MSNDGGAIRNALNSNGTVSNCLFSGNTGGKGGAIWHQNQNSGDMLLTNCSFTGNDAIGRGEIPDIGDCILVTNATVTLSNCILWGDGPSPFGVGEEIYLELGGGGAVANVDYSDVEGGEGDVFGVGLNWGDGNIGEDPVNHDPLFVNAPFRNYRLLGGSPCIDAASNLEVPPDVADLDNDENTVERTPRDLDLKPRFVDDPDTLDTGVFDPGPPEILEVVDMGAYEYDSCGLCPTDTPVVGPNGSVGPEDLAYILGNWGPFSENPACNPECPAALVCIDDLVPIAGNEQIGAEDLAKVLGTWGPCCGDGICLQGLPGQPQGDETCGAPDECEDDCGPCP